jgi:hypothetical protein
MYVAVVYAQGYKYSFKDKQFLHTGAIQIKVNDDAKVFLNDELDGSTSFLGNSHTIDGLLPGFYTIRLEREGFTDWEKSVEVQEGLITDFPKILILATSEVEAPKILDEIGVIMASDEIVVASGSIVTPTPKPITKPSPSVLPTPSISATPLPDSLFILENKVLYLNTDNALKVFATNVSGFHLSENNNKILWWNDRDLWVGWLADTDYQPYKKNGDRELITHFASPIKKAAWFRDEDHIVVDSNGYKVVEIDKRGGQNIIRL